MHDKLEFSQHSLSNKMDFRGVLLSLILICALNQVNTRSIDQIIEDAETEYIEKHGPDSRSSSSVWFDYEMPGREEELVKVQLDMVMTKEQWDSVIDTEEVLPERQKRNAVKNKMRLWPRRIPYKISKEFKLEHKILLMVTMDHWEEHTCLHFVEAGPRDYDHIEFVPHSSKCESLLGRMKGRQVIYLAPTCMDRAVIVHEIGHALGLFHEHMRADRDDYVTVHYEHILEKHHREFDKLRPRHYNDYNKPYDYESIMHYGKLYFSRNRTAELLTIVPKEVSYLNAIGNGSSLSFYDVQIISNMYECSSGCLHKGCPGNGFLGKNCECYCTGENMYDIILCNDTDNCGTPNISLADFRVYHSNNDEVSEWSNETSYTHGTKFGIEHRNSSCGRRFEFLNCSDGQWMGEEPPCEKACFVEEYNNEYLVITDEPGGIALPGQVVLSSTGIYVSCNNSKGRNENFDKYIECSDGQWSYHINDIECREEEHPLCNMVLNGHIDGTFEEGFTVTCPQGYELEIEGGPGNKFNCSWEGLWEPVTPKCTPRNCVIPIINGGRIIGENGEAFNEADVIMHGSDVTLNCDRKYIPVEEKILCRFGILKTTDESEPQCKLASCTIPPVENGKLYNKNEELFNDVDLLHGNDVTLKCDRGHVPDEATLICNHRKWNTDDGQFQKCNLVECPQPTIVKTRGYKPRKEKYIYGDTVTVFFCQGNLFLEGSSSLMCQKNGEWSDSAVCKPFCNHGVYFKEIKNMEITGVRYKSKGLGSYSSCKRACQSFKRFLCLSFVYGYKDGRHHCRLYRYNAEKIQHKMAPKPFWTIGVRGCASKEL